MSTSEARLVTVQEVVLCEKGSDLVEHNVHVEQLVKHSNMNSKVLLYMHTYYQSNNVIEFEMEFEIDHHQHPNIHFYHNSPLSISSVFL